MENLRDNCFEDGKFHDSYIISLLKKDWNLEVNSLIDITLNILIKRVYLGQIPNDFNLEKDIAF